MKNILILTLCFLFVSAYSQETMTQDGTVSKSGVPILPSAGDIAIGIDALPFLEFVGNTFNNHTNNTLNLMSTNLYLRYHLTETSAIRVILSINSNETINRNYVQDDAAVFSNPLSNAKVEDKQKIFTQGYGLNVAFQRNRGYGRLRGLYGVQATYGLNRVTNKFEYGNSMTVANPMPTTSFGAGSPRVIENDGGLQQRLGAGLLGGVEYYFLPKACIGFEVGLNYNINWRSQSNFKTQEIVGTTLVEKDVVVAPEGLSGQGINTSNNANYPFSGMYGNAGLYLMFHF